jgi:hypothetical protein
MTRKSLKQKLAARRNKREFERALEVAPASMRAELRAIAARQPFGL